jgi:methyl-accepting chemotaxis protein
MIKAFMNLRVGIKIGITFGLVLALGVALGGVALLDIREVQKQSQKLAREYAPEVAESGHLERHSLLTMYNMRGYALSGDETYLTRGREYLAEVRDDLKNAQSLAQQYEDLARLRERLGDARTAVDTYEGLVEKTVSFNRAISGSRETLDAAADRYVTNLREFIDQQTATLSQEIRAGAFSESLLERLEKLQLLQRIMDSGNAIRIANFKAQARRNYEAMREVTEGFDAIQDLLRRLRTITVDEEGLRRIEAAASAADDYRTAMENQLKNRLAIESLDTERDTVAKEVLDIAQDVFVTGMDQMIAVAADTDALLSRTVTVSLVGLAAGVLLAAAVVVFLTRLITRPIREVMAATKRFGNGDLTATVAVGSEDEIGQMAGDLNRSIGNLRALMQEMADAANTLSSASGELSSVSSEMAASAEEMNAQAGTVAAASEQVSASVGTVASAAEEASGSVSSIASMTEEMSSTFGTVSGAGRKTADNVTAMARSSEDISSQVNSVASAAEEMTTSLNEVAKNTVQASRISQNAKSRTEDINSRIDALVDASKQIGKVVGVIKDIADQTNMLALNATIEAAGAGDAGKGFAVVAGEVKELARQSADATDEIADQIDQIQRSTDDAVAAIEEINKIIGEIAGINEMIASSSEEQTATASEISKSVAGAAVTVKEVAENAGESADLVGEIAHSIDEASKTAAEVARNIDELLNGVKEVARSSDEAARGVNDISKNIQNISQASRQTASGAAQTDRSSKELAEMASKLSQLVGRFKL